MTGDAGTVRPTNCIVANSQSLRLTTKKVETATNVYPGRLLEQGTNDDDVVVCGGSNAVVGVAGYEHTAKKWRPASVTTIYAQNDKIAVLSGPGTELVLSIKSGEAAVVGTLLAFAAAGQVAVATAGTHHVIAKAKETVTGANNTGSPILCELIGV
jgi:hypothetical protein